MPYIERVAVGGAFHSGADDVAGRGAVDFDAFPLLGPEIHSPVEMRGS